MTYIEIKNGIEYKVCIDNHSGIFTFNVIEEYVYHKRKGVLTKEKNFLLFSYIDKFLKKHGIELGYAYRVDRDTEKIDISLNNEQVQHFKGLTTQLNRDKLIESLLYETI